MTGAEHPVATSRRNPRMHSRVAGREQMQEDLEQNVLGVTAGFFCAIWAGRLLGERVSYFFTTLGPCAYNSNQESLCSIGLQDIAVLGLLASKLLFVHAWAMRYVLRPMVSRETSAGGRLEFDDVQKRAEHVAGLLARLCSLALCLAAWNGWIGGVWMRVGVLALVAGRLAACVADWLQNARVDRRVLVETCVVCGMALVALNGGSFEQRVRTVCVVLGGVDLSAVGLALGAGYSGKVACVAAVGYLGITEPGDSLVMVSCCIVVFLAFVLWPV